MYVPLVIIIACSFNDLRLNVEWVGFTWHWYKVLLHDDNYARRRRQLTIHRVGIESDRSGTRHYVRHRYPVL